MTPDIREKAERLLDALSAFQAATREHKIGALSQALLEAHEAGMKAALDLLNEPGALRANLLRGSIKAPDDLVWLHDTNGPVAAKVLEAHNAGRAEERERLFDALMEPSPQVIAGGLTAYELTGISATAIGTAEDHVELIWQAMLSKAKSE